MLVYTVINFYSSILPSYSSSNYGLELFSSNFKLKSASRLLSLRLRLKACASGSDSLSISVRLALF